MPQSLSKRKCTYKTYFCRQHHKNGKRNGHVANVCEKNTRSMHNFSKVTIIF